VPRLHGALLKNEQDVQLFERLAFMARGQRYVRPAAGNCGRPSSAAIMT
jgi:hypothetical protein